MRAIVSSGVRPTRDFPLQEQTDDLSLGGLDLLARDDQLGIAVAQLQRRAEHVVIGDGEQV